ncbi:MAG: hypothetical protein ACRC1U_00605, partial [Vibrionaceae bacterium]
NGDDSNFDILLNGEKQIHHEEYHLVEIGHQFPILDGQVALIELYTGGTACPMLYQLIVSRKDSPSMISTVFGTCSDLGKLSMGAQGFTLDIPGNPREVWSWNANNLMLRRLL